MSGVDIKLLQRHIANVAIGAATARGAGAGGVVAAARLHLGATDLRALAASNDVPSFLDAESEALQQALPEGAQHWGLARKLLNVFLRDCVYNHFLRSHFELDRIEPKLEIPIDSYVQYGLKEKAARRQLPRWRGVIHLTPEENKAYQTFAFDHLEEWQADRRVHLDAILWGNGRQRSAKARAIRTT